MIWSKNKAYVCYFMMSRHCMNRPLWMTSPRSALNPTIKWWNVTLVLASTWPSACSTVEMLCPKTSMQPLLPSRLARRSSLLTGVQQGLRFLFFLFFYSVKPHFQSKVVSSKWMSFTSLSIKFYSCFWATFSRILSDKMSVIQAGYYSGQT